MKVRFESCLVCPYRRDVPSGVWSEDEYDKLFMYDEMTGDQPPGYFACHATPDFICHGWAMVGEKVVSRHGRSHELLGLRMLASMGLFDFGELDLVREGTPLFDSHTEASEHGKRDIKNPSPEAREAVARLQEKYERLRDG